MFNESDKAKLYQMFNESDKAKLLVNVTEKSINNLRHI